MRITNAGTRRRLSDSPPRYIWDGLRTQRLDRPYVRADGKLTPCGLDDAFAGDRRSHEDIGRRCTWQGRIVGDLAAAEEMFALKELSERLGSPNIDCRQAGAKFNPALGRATYVFNTSIAGIEDADALLLVGCDPQIEAPVLNARIRKRWKQLEGHFPVGVIGADVDLTYPYVKLGAGPETLAEVASGKNDFAKILKDAKKPMVVLGQAAFARPDGYEILAVGARIVTERGAIDEGWNGFNVLHTAAARVAGLDLGFVPGEKGFDTGRMIKAAGTGELDVLYLLGADEIDIPELGDAFVIYQGSHGDKGAHRADVILPGAAYTEKDGTYVNTEGRAQMTARAIFPPGEAREDWTILRDLAKALGKPLGFETLRELRAKMYAAAPQLARLDTLEPADAGPIVELARHTIAPGDSPFGLSIADYYLSNPIARASAIMASLSAMHADEEKATGTDG